MQVGQALDSAGYLAGSPVYEAVPGARQGIDPAAGYTVFSIFGLKFFLR